MNAIHLEIVRSQRQFMDLFEQQKAYLAGKPKQYVEDLAHAAGEAKSEAVRAGEFSKLAAAEINLAACSVVLEK